MSIPESNKRKIFKKKIIYMKRTDYHKVVVGKKSLCYFVPSFFIATTCTSAMGSASAGAIVIMPPFVSGPNKPDSSFTRTSSPPR